MARHGENIYLRKDGRYEGRYVIGKKQNGCTAFGYVYGKRYTEVKKKLTVLKGEQAQQGNSSRFICGDESIKDWVITWLEVHIKNSVKVSTYSIYRSQMEKYVIPAIGSIKLCEADKSVMTQLYKIVKASSTSEKMAQNICRRFRALLKTAQEENMIYDVPPLPFKKAVSDKKKPRYLTETEQKHLIGQLGEDKAKDLAILFGLYTGVRIGECCALKWKDIDFKEEDVCISHTLQRITVYDYGRKTILNYTSAKTENAVRRIPLTENLLKSLLRLKEASQAGQDDFVFGTHKPIEPRNLQYHTKRLANVSGLEDLHFHTLRHTFATRCIEKGTDIKTLSELLGHSSVKITLDWYCHSTKEQKKAIINKVFQ